MRMLSALYDTPLVWLKSELKTTQNDKKKTEDEDEEEESSESASW